MIYLVVMAFLANVGNGRMLALTMVVAASIFASPPQDSYQSFLTFCIAAECTVAAIAMGLRANASTAIIALCAMLVVSHVTGWVQDGSPPLSPYKFLVQSLEHAEIAACIILSNPFIRKLRNT